MNTRFDEVFRISIILKGLDAAAEIIGGTFLLFITPHDIQHFVHWLTAQELSTDPHDFISTLLVHSTHNLSAGSTLFATIYLLSHGVIKLFIIINVLRNKYWAYPALIIVLIGFIVYQVIQIIHSHSIGLILLTLFDVFVIIMTTLEWQKQIGLREEIKESEK
jgi:uncharacterized membrane protein